MLKRLDSRVRGNDSGTTEFRIFNCHVNSKNELAHLFRYKHPKAEMEFKGNFQALVDDLEKLDKKIGEIVARDPDRALLGSHPVYDYLSSGYGINLESVHWEPDEVPTVSQWNNLSHILEEHQTKHMLWEGDPLEGTVTKLMSKGIDSVTFRPSASSPEEGNFMTVMQKHIAGLELVYR